MNFFGDNLHFLGHDAKSKGIDAKRLHMNQSKVQAIEKTSKPSDIMQSL